ncbi:hypothetical protein OF83DRAFT_1023286, partial [Amylostereum chailletii]
QDWPPTSSFKEDHRDWYDVIVDGIPLKVRDWIRPDGAHNLMAHFAKNAKRPDGGPKAYNALSSGDDEDGGHATTYLHEDMSYAFNILLYSEPRRDGSQGAARWDIIHPDDADLFRDIAVEEKLCIGLGDLDPIHSQLMYLSPATIEMLKGRGVRVYTIFQHVGELVTIPVKSPHQVTNLSDANKIACDFLNPLHLHDTEVVAKELRKHRLSTMEGEDVLQLYHCLWWAW